MRLKIDQDIQQFIDIRVFRNQHNLPENFGVSQFERKSYEGLGTIQGSGEALRQMRQIFVAALPAYTTPVEWLLAQSDIQGSFLTSLLSINDQVGLREPEIDFAVAGFVNVYSQWVYTLIHAASSGKPPKAFQQVYQDWLFETIRVANQCYVYNHQDKTWEVQLISHVYGRVGLKIQQGDDVVYVYDHSLACPAEHFMEGLLADTAAHIQKSCEL